VERWGPTVDPHVYLSAFSFHIQRKRERWIKIVRTYRIIPDFEILDFHSSFLRYSPQEESCRCVTRISLIGVGLDNYTLVHTGSMAWFILAFVVRVDLLVSAFVGHSAETVDSRHDRHLPRSRNCWQAIDDTQSWSTRPTGRSAQRRKGEDSIQLLDMIHFRLLRYRIE
jgi:hypothetical protein